MPRTRKEIAKEMGTTGRTVTNHARKLGKSVNELTNQEEEELMSSIEINKRTKEEHEEQLTKLYVASDGFTPNVRRIDLNNYSSIENTLQDAKERYVKNEEIIQRLQNEVDALDVTMNSNSNGTVSSIPQLPMIEKYVKLNIALRNQILEIEDKLGRHGKADDNDPFN